jgi:hypothetical protein
MKESAVVVLLMIASLAQAHVPKAGDDAKYQGTNQGQVQTEDYSNSGFDSQSSQWSVFHDIRGPSPDMGFDYVATLWSSQAASDIITNCATQKGQVLTVTVPAGTFQTCMIDDGKHTAWLGEVPIWGLVKYLSDDGTYSTELQSYVWADSLTP